MKKNFNLAINAHSQYRDFMVRIFLLLIMVGVSSCNQDSSLELIDFDGQEAYEFVSHQLSFGPRIPGESGHELTISLIENTLSENNWEVVTDPDEFQGIEINNIVGKKGDGDTWIIIGAHYDTRIYADQDIKMENRLKPVPGANDGGSGVGILLELSRVIPDLSSLEIWLVFFDQEDSGNINGQDWIIGSRNFVDNLDKYPDKVIILDMVGDNDLNIYFEKSSDNELSKEIWQIADNLGYGEYFVPEVRFNMIDDHTPFIQKGISAIDIIDFDYPYWHTTEDTLDKISAESLEIVGKTILEWILLNGAN